MECWREAAAAVLLALAPITLLEGGLRLAGWPTERVRTFGKLLNFDTQSFAAAIGVFRPGARATVLWPPELAYEVHVNALGLRGPEIARKPPPGRTRILALGDSQTFGFYLAEPETWPARLEALMRAQGRDVEVVNGGVGGWSIPSETLFLEERGLALAPAHVVLAFCGNDIPDLDRPNVYEGQKKGAAVGRGTLERVIATSATYELYLRGQVAWKQWRSLHWSDGSQPPMSAAALTEDRSAELWNVYAGWLDRMQSGLSARGIPLTVVYVPAAADFANTPSAGNEARLRDLARERGITFVSPLADFTGHPLEQLYFLPLDHHLAPDGAARLAQAVAAELAREIR